MTTPLQIKRWMSFNLDEFTDPETGEVNCTLMAESACDCLAGYEGDEIPDVYYEMALEVAQGFEL